MKHSQYIAALSRRAVDGVDVPWANESVDADVLALRSSVTLAEQPLVTLARVQGERAYEAVDRAFAREPFPRDGQLRHTLALREDGTILADAYVTAEEDGGFLVLAEGADGPALRAHILGAGEPCEVTDLGQTHCVLTINGPFAWELLAEMEGPELIGFPYLTSYRPDERSVYARAGKTGEYGYDLVVPRERRDEVWDRVVEAGAALDLRCVGVGALWHAMLEAWFFNAFREGRARDVTPLELGLRWRLGMRRDFIGRDALLARRAAGVARRAVALLSDQPLPEGAEVSLDGEPVGVVLASERSASLEGRWIAHAHVADRCAVSGLDGFEVARPDAPPSPARTVSPPYVNNRSIFVSPQKHTYSSRHEIPMPPLARVW